MQLLTVIGFFVAWFFFVYATYKGHSAIYMSLAASIVVLVFGGMDIKEGIMGAYMGGLVGLASACFPLILLGSILGRLYVDSGAANSIAFALDEKLMKNASPNAKKLLTIALTYIVGVLLCYGGVDTAAVLFTLVPLALVFFEGANIPRRYAAAICVHVSNMCLAGWAAPSFYNIYPSIQLGTNAKAGVAGGVTVLVINLIGGILLAYFYVRQDAKKGLPGFEWGQARKPDYDKDNMPKTSIALIPIVVAMVLFILLNWHFVASIGVASILALLLFYKNFKVDPGSSKFLAIKDVLGKGTASGINGALVICSMAGFGAVVRLTPVYTFLTPRILALNISPVLVYALLIAALGLVTASASAGFQTGLGGVFMSIEGRMGLSNAVLHRVGAQAAASTNLFPWTGIVFVSHDLAGLTHKEGYSTMLKLPVLIWIGSSIISVIMYTLIPSLP